MSLVNLATSISSMFAGLSGKSLSSFCALETAASDTVLVAKDGSLVTLVRVDGASRLMGRNDIPQLVRNLTLEFTPHFRTPGHAMQMWFGRDPDYSPEIIRDLTQTPRTVAKALRLDLDDVFEERERIMPRHVVWEGVYIALWTRMSVLTKQESNRLKEEMKAPEAWPVAVDTQNIFLATNKLMTEHSAFVQSFMGSLGKVGIRAQAMEVHDALKGVRASIYPDTLMNNWKPVLPSDLPAIRASKGKRGDNSAFLWPRLEEQLFLREGETINSRIIRVGRHLMSGLDLEIGPQEIKPFSDLISYMNATREFPWRASFKIEGGGLKGLDLKGFLASIVAFSNSQNHQIKDAIADLRELQRMDEEIVRMRVSFCTWAPSDDLKLMEDRASRLAKAVENWGSCVVASTAGDPGACTLSSAVALTPGGTAPALAAPLSDVISMMPWDRDASPWAKGSVLFRTMDGRPWPYQPGSSKQNSFIDLVFGPPGLGKSVFLNTTNLALALAPTSVAQSGGASLPRIAIIDIGPSSSGLISLIQEALPRNRRHEAVYATLRMEKGHAINPFDTQLGARYPLATDRAFLVNFLTLLGTPIGQKSPPDELAELAGVVVDELYATFDDGLRTGHPRLYSPGECEEVDEAVRRFGIQIEHDITTWWQIVDALFKLEEYHLASVAQRYAVPRIEDIAQILHTSKQISDVYGSKQINGEKLLLLFQRMVSSALREYPILTRPTQIDFSDSRIVALDLGEAAPSGGGEALDKQAALVYMLARFVLARDYYLNDQILGIFPEEYRGYQARRIQQVRETPKKIVYDEFHRTSSSIAVRNQVVRDIREGRKWGVHIALASQLIDDFDDTMVDMATGVWIMGAGAARNVEKIQKIFHLSDAATEKVANVLRGPGPKGAPFLAVLSLKDNKHEHLLVNTTGPSELWAFSTTAEDVELRNRLYRRLDAREARQRLARIFPSGSAKGEIEKRTEENVRAGADPNEAADGIINTLVSEIVQGSGVGAAGEARAARKKAG